jgi:hypothetical protein
LRRLKLRGQPDERSLVAEPAEEVHAAVWPLTWSERHGPPITEMLWWNPRRTMDPAHAWLRARIAEIAAELDQADPAA